MQEQKYEKVRAWLELLRISNSPTIVSNVLAGSALALTQFSFGQAALLVITILLLYWAGMIFNDVCDAKIDKLNRPMRPLPSGRISRITAVCVGLEFTAIALGILWFFGAQAALAGLGLIVLIILYNLWHKSNPISPIIMGTCRALVYIISVAALASTLSVNVIIAGLGLLLYTLALTMAAKEINHERIPGWLIKILLLSPAVAVTLLLSPNLSISVLISFLICAAWLLWTTAASRVTRGDVVIARLIAGISLYDGIVVAATGWTVGIYIAVACFGLTLFVQRFIKGT